MTIARIVAGGFIAIGLFMIVRTVAVYLTGGFIDLDAFEREHFSDAETTDGIRADLARFRSRFGPIVPARALWEWTRARLREAEAKKARILAEADTQGRTINLAELGQRLRASGYLSDQAIAWVDETLRQLEARYGPDVPASVVAVLADELTDE